MTIRPAKTRRKAIRISAAPEPYVTPPEYLARERQAEIKSEYYGGEVFAMAGGSEEHSLIAGKTHTELNLQLRERPCKVYNSDMRVQLAEEGPHTYPVVTVVYGEARFADAKVVTLINPAVIVEVLSPITEGWDRGGKFERYQWMPSVQENLLIAEDRPRVERYARQAEGEWLLTVATGRNGVVTLPSVGYELALREVYRKVDFSEDAGPRR